MEVVYHFAVIVISLVVFSLNITARVEFMELFLKFLGKIVPFFCMLYAGVQIFKHFNVI